MVFIGLKETHGETSTGERYHQLTNHQLTDVHFLGQRRFMERWVANGPLPLLDRVQRTDG
jgi:hypothetical protein